MKGRTVLPLLGCLVLAGFLAFAQLGARPLVSPGEARYALIAREMLAGGDWVQPRLNGVRYDEKPPLLYWSVAASYRLFGQTEVASRVPSAAAYVATVAVTFFLAHELLGAATAPLAALVFATSAGPVLFGRLLSTDTLDSDRRDQLNPIAPRLRDEPVGEVCAPDPFGESRVVLDPLGHSCLPPHRAAVDHDSVNAFASGVDGCRQARRTATDDGQVVGRAVGLDFEPELAGQLLI